MTEIRKIKLGILGCGPIAQHAHLPAAKKSKWIDLVAICDRAKDLLETVASQYQVRQRYTDHKEFLKSGDIEAVLLAVADAFHVPLALECLHAGKHVLLEKPVALSSEQGQKLLRAAEAIPLKILLGNMKRHDPGVEFARQFVKEKMGDPLSVSGWYRDTEFRPQIQESLFLPAYTSEHSERPADDPKADKENYSLLTHGVHLVNTLQFIGGPIRRILGKKAQRSGSHSWHAVLEYESEAIGHFELTVRIAGQWSEGFEAHGKSGSVSGQMFFPFLRKASEVRAFDMRTQVTETPYSADGDSYKRQMDSFARSIIEDTPPACSVAEGIQDLRVLEALKRSIESLRWEDV